MLKRDINDGGAAFLNRLGRKFNNDFILASLVASQQYYQFPYKVLRVSNIRVKNGSFWYTPTLITSEEEWNGLNAITVTANYPLYWYIRGFNQLGLYPLPAGDVAGGLEISYNPQQVQMTAADFTTGTVAVTNGSATVTHSSTGFTAQMVGLWLQITDGTDGSWYKIGAFVSTSEITLENYYEGPTGTAATFRIGEVMAIPESFQDAPVYYALEKYYLSQGDQNSANGYAARFEEKIKLAKATYGKSTANSGVRKDTGRRRQPKWIDLTPSVSYP